MAEIIPSGARGRRNGGRFSTRVDLTPMVDLGFLLISFFVFTTSLSEANAMRVILPTDGGEQNPTLVPVSKTLSVVLSDNDNILYYHGLNQGQVQTTSYAASGIRRILQEKVAVVDRLYGHPGETIVLIKPTEAASYRNLVDMLDEMRINGIRKYVLMEASAEEAAMAVR